MNDHSFGDERDQATGDTVEIFPAATEVDLAWAARVQAVVESGDFAEARRLIGIDDAKLTALQKAWRRAP
jgi:hypothetical protein